MKEHIELEQIQPADIEARSFEIITQELGDRVLDPLQAPIIKRCIHTTADFSYADNLCFSRDVVSIAREALKNGCTIVTHFLDCCGLTSDSGHHTTMQI